MVFKVDSFRQSGKLTATSPEGATDCIVMFWLDNATYHGLSMFDGATHPGLSIFDGATHPGLSMYDGATHPAASRHPSPRPYICILELFCIFVANNWSINK